MIAICIPEHFKIRLMPDLLLSIIRPPGQAQIDLYGISAICLRSEGDPLEDLCREK